MRKKVIAGNWKMNKTNTEAVEMLTELKELVKGIDNVGIIIGAPFTALSDAVKAVKGSNIAIAAENVYPKDSGAYTGEVSPVMLKSIGVEYVILGHSERREYFKESDEFINEKVKAVLAAGMLPILCIGEKLEERESGKTAEVTETQIRGGLKDLTAEEAKKVIVAYEPVWAIGTGRTATPEMAQETHRQVRDVLVSMFGNETAEEMIIQYGGSMKPDNAVELLAQKDIDGGLIGGASLKASSFAEIVVAGK
ncbi:MAG: triose-phosphate isomerase [Fusobacterium varium]|jgi:triosephosphate isomerase|uniref:Triosephosphate isomerase n=1 Tax=Fusobacterium varium ATCC 27725 TaxID=469618 RepID=A0ABN5JEQ7_FUSVA|nr:MULTISPECIES: triose-phosphate isomerase [Fusobacterium]AVQ30252.1 triose-phosphate isomerase [Fusobacterium varium ATCC 27725]EES64716.1 triose-phosphate isomerase [Fusobacterium varium ATCC 27725]MCD7980128.1 triose-phosphate isomerase [Fusobacterium sp.]MCF2671846.1 triose-phosphate isomerase [Fusobacterium varium]MCI6033464.1 triose-phosphate isomerase [Fusobacterium varium]